MEEILKSVTEAEERANAIREAAEEQAAQIIATAEEKAAKIARESETVIKLLREEKIRKSSEKAQADYARATENEVALQKKNADELIAKTDREVAAVVRRITGGNR